MKKILILAGTFVLFSMIGFGQPKNFRDIIGRWDISGEENAGATLQIIDSSTIFLTYMGEKKKIIDCKIDFTKSPIRFDFSTKDSSSVLKMKSLMQIIGDDMIMWQLFDDEDYADHFSSTKGELFYLKKAKPVSNTIVVNN